MSDLPDVSFTTDSPQQIVESLKNEGCRHVWVMGGGEIHSLFFNAGLIDEMRIFVMPKILGEGISLFAPPVADARWNLLSHRNWHSNIVELRYAKIGQSPKQVLTHWIELFNQADAAAIAELYHEDAVNHQVANEPIRRLSPAFLEQYGDDPLTKPFIEEGLHEAETYDRFSDYYSYVFYVAKKV